MLVQLYRESTAENELLYERFNGELAKIVRALKGKGREDKEELMARMRDASEETARVKKENARLRREMASLRSFFRGPVTPTSAGTAATAAAAAAARGAGAATEVEVGAAGDA